MLFGMGTVFVFLTILVFATTLMSKLVARFAPQSLTPDTQQVDTVASDSPTPSPQIMVAIKHAIAAHRQR